jgi:uncharacterized protein YlzI (FlbEa/FlbD family)
MIKLKTTDGDALLINVLHLVCVYANVDGTYARTTNSNWLVEESVDEVNMRVDNALVKMAWLAGGSKHVA